MKQTAAEHFGGDAYRLIPRVSVLASLGIALCFCHLCQCYHLILVKNVNTLLNCIFNQKEINGIKYVSK